MLTLPTGSPNATPAAIPRSLTLAAINGWRGPGAVAIALGHFAVATDYEGVDRFQCIAVFVDLFFVLSGVIIAQAYGTKLGSVGSIPAYAIRRFGRIWPVHAVILGLLVAYECLKLAMATIAGKTFSSPPFASDGFNLLSAIPTNLVLVHSLGIHDRETWNFPSWSLSVEFVVYIVFALFCLVAPVPRRILAVATIVLSLAILIWVAPHGMRSTYDYGVFRCLAGFFAGALVYEIAARWTMPRWPLPTAVEIAALSAVGVWIVWSEDTLAVFTAPFVFCALILVFASERGAVSRLMKTWLFQKGAELSFAIYMVHAVVLIGFMVVCHEVERVFKLTLFVEKTFPWQGTVSVLHVANGAIEAMLLTAYFGVVMLSSVIVFHYVEVPGRAFFNRLAGRVAAPRRAVERARGAATTRHRGAA